MSIPQNRSFNNNPFNLSLKNLKGFQQQLAEKEKEPVYYVGVDVGTGSARAAVVDQFGSILGLSERPITRHELKASYITQSSSEIWDAICYCVKTSVSQSHIDPGLVLGVGFDATCSLVAINESNNEPMPVGPDFSDELENIILWMDHRAQEEVDEINASGDECLKYVGGTMSIEMELPKMKWLKNHLPIDKDTGKSMFLSCKFFDLADWLTFRATDNETRSFCSTVCKQGFVPQGITNRNGWSKEFLTKVHVPELAEDNFRRLGGLPGRTGKYLSAGDTVGKLSDTAAEELGLTTNCYVASGVIDAYAGWIGTVAASTESPIPDLIEQDKTKSGIAKSSGRLAAVAGTSTCHIILDEKPIFVPGVWGPYRDVMAQGYWMAEGGQSCTGALLAHVLSTHPAYTELGVASEASSLSRFDFLNSRLETLRKTRKERSVVALAKDLFFYGDFHGNRSPIADPRMKASIIGQSMDVSLDSLAIEYLGACEFIGQQTRQIVEKMEASGYEINSIFMSGGQCRNGLLMRLLADTTGLPIVIPRYIDASVVFGAAMLGAVAANEALKKTPANAIGRSRKNSTASFGTAKDDVPHSPYTAPSATASMTSISALAQAVGGAPSYPFPLMTPIEDESKQLGHQEEEEEEEEEEVGISFNTNHNTQKKVQDHIVEQKIKDVLPRKTSTGRGGRAEKPGDKLWKVMRELSGVGKVIFPSNENDPDRKLLNTKYKIFLDQIESQQKYRKMVGKTEEAIKAYLSI